MTITTALRLTPIADEAETHGSAGQPNGRSLDDGPGARVDSVTAWARIVDLPPHLAHGPIEPTRTYRQELEGLCQRYLPIAAGASVLAWVPYAFLDAQIHPEIPALPWLRLGFTAVSVVVLLLWRFTSLPRTWLALAHGAYLEVITGLVTGLVGADPVYIGGYCMVLILALLPPLPIAWTWGMLVASLVTFFALVPIDAFPAGSGLYSRNDLLTGAALAFVFAYLADRLRHRTWVQGAEIERQKARLEWDNARIDALLLNVLPPAIAGELKDTGGVVARHHPDATVVFVDFAGFTRASEAMDPGSLLSALHRCFSRFDAIVGALGLEKLKTIGDAYMFAGGVPAASATHAADCVEAALRIRDELDRFAAEEVAAGRPGWRARIGVHTGPLVAGVVGTRKFAYDVWGDTVNLASRMESSGIPGEVNVSAATAARLGPDYTLVPRGRVPAKHKGEVEMFLVRRAPSPAGAAQPSASVVTLGIASAASRRRVAASDPSTSIARQASTTTSTSKPARRASSAE